MELKVLKIKEKSFRAGASDELLRLDRFLFRREIIPSMKSIRTLIERGGVLLNDRVVHFPSKKIVEGDRVFIRGSIFPIFDNKKADPEIIYKDDSILVINKPSGVLSVEEVGFHNYLKKFLERSIGKFFPAHRLDKETSGIMVFARTKRAEEFLKKEFKEKRVKKVYLAILNGILKMDSGVIKGIMKASGEYGESEFLVKERHKWTTLVEVCPKTGRTNQIRIQFSEMGCPLVGENKYLISSRNHCVIFPRLALHSLKLSFYHPDSPKLVTFSATPPDEILSFLDFLRSEWKL